MCYSVGCLIFCSGKCIVQPNKTGQVYFKATWGWLIQNEFYIYVPQLRARWGMKDHFCVFTQRTGRLLAQTEGEDCPFKCLSPRLTSIIIIGILEV